MINQNVILTLALAACLAPVSGFADVMGDPAAPLTVKEWIKGGPVDIKAGTNIYVVEFWAALSTASRAAIPKLNELQKKFKDKGVVMVGISDEPADRVRQFVEARDQIDYIVAADDRRKTARNYMVAYGQNGIPHAFVVGKDGKVLWHGYPLQGLENALDEIIAGRYDLAQARKLDSVRGEVAEYRALARRGDPKATELGRKLLTDRTNNPVALCDLAYRIITDSYNTNRDLVLAGEVLNQAQKLAPTNTPQLVLARGLLLFEQGQKQEGIALARQAVDLTKDPHQKESAEVYLNIMEGRWEAEKKRKSAPAPPASPKP
jgi:peroxiredoxin